MTQKTFHSQTATFIDRIASSFPSDLTGDEMQKCIDDPKGLNAAILAWVRPGSSIVEARSEMITYTVRVNRNQTPLQAFSGTTHKQHLDNPVVKGMPLGTGEEVTLCFFPIKKQMTCSEYAQALADRGLQPDPMAQAAFNQVNPEFADKYPNGTQWQDKKSNFCYALWGGWDGVRKVGVSQDSFDWHDYWFACGVRK